MHDATEMREKLFTMRLDAEERGRLDRLADHYGLNAAGLVRMLIKKEERALGDELAPQAHKKPKK